MAISTKLTALSVAALALAALFIFQGSGGNWDYIIPRRAVKVAAIVLTGSAIAFATLVFQTITNNRILTPSIIGMDAMYMLVQTTLVFLFGTFGVIALNENLNFMLSVGCMMLFALWLYRTLFGRGDRHLYTLLLAGIVMGTLFASMTTFMQVLIDPNEFMRVQDRMFASFNNVNTDVLLISVLLLGGAAVFSLTFTPYLDVISLGRDQAVNLGIDYNAVVKRSLIAIAVLISVSTALVGPITFLGLIVANVAVQLLKTYRHRILIPGAMLISIIALLGGQWIVERVFTFSTTLSVIINFVGGVYFLYLLLKENRSW